ncbi:MAG TPA: carbonic anhydrase [Thermoleophilaceae bacterium]|jgi:carbonic anhydrase
MAAIDELLQRNEGYARDFQAGDLPAPPSLQVAVVSCMDARLDLHRILGLSEGEAHVIRNAGGVVTPEVIRSLSLSQHKLGTREVVLIQHTRCGLEGLDNEGFARELDEQTGGAERDWEVGGFADVEQSVRRSMGLVRESPFLPHTDAVRGFVYEVESGRVREVSG